MQQRSLNAGENRRIMSWSERLAAHWLLKSIGTATFIAVFIVLYLYLLKNPVFAVTEMPLTAVDRVIDFQPLTLPLYLSLWVYVSLPPALIETRRQLINYGLAVGALCLTGLAVFLIWPSAVPAPDINWARYPAFDFLKNIDGTGNACPSLHAATAVYSAIWLERLICEINRSTAMRIMNWIWCIGIVYSALATKQHVALDVLAGAMLGIMAAALSLRPAAGIISGAQHKQPLSAR